ncbi:hypothetical protein HH310_06225 [Actinoplanes sp. TBRC 11911]|uniref:hypothetical protein n=1 Tax=Actinoplanes sp. TBRC 11911 TaxID=2729386 RepID=UPI00145C862E|nr:hypothetical protein [Actinoplanes sp. TBRC 11911]NMO50789.1 hypothetical protein [Actinoplanes sp. TBRC 11911]
MDVQGLTPVAGFPFPVFTSAGGAERARMVAERAARTIAWLDRVVGLPETPPLFVLGPDDWDKVATTPLYGMPHVETDRIVVGQQPAPFWNAVIGTVVGHVEGGGLRRLHDVYGNPIDIGLFADLLVAHELTHLTDREWAPGPVGFWLGELVANLGLHGYVTEVEPEQTMRLTTIFEVTWSAPNDHWPVRDLAHMEKGLEGDGSNYVWFEFGLLVLAKRLWETAGAKALQRLVGAMRGPELGFDEVVKLLDELDPAVGQAIRNWPGSPPPGSPRPNS